VGPNNFTIASCQQGVPMKKNCKSVKFVEDTDNHKAGRFYARQQNASRVLAIALASVLCPSVTLCSRIKTVQA